MTGNDTPVSGDYRCHSSTNDVSTLLLTDPVYNDRLQEVLQQ